MLWPRTTIYGYVDGAGFVRLSMAFDVLFTGLKQLRDDISRARNTVRCLSRSGGRSAQAQQRYRHVRPTLLAARLVHSVSRGSSLRPTYSRLSHAEVYNFGMVNALITEQGPNYARPQRWGWSSRERMAF